MQKRIQENVYTLDLSYDKRDYTVDTIIRKIESWKRTPGSNITFIKDQVNLGGFGIFKCVSKRLLVTVNKKRHMKVMCEVLGIPFNVDKFSYEKDLFQLF